MWVGGHMLNLVIFLCLVYCALTGDRACFTCIFFFFLHLVTLFVVFLPVFPCALYYTIDINLYKKNKNTDIIL